LCDVETLMSFSFVGVETLMSCSFVGVETLMIVHLCDVETLKARGISPPAKGYVHFGWWRCRRRGGVELQAQRIHDFDRIWHGLWV
jgi:hypothetical protein